MRTIAFTPANNKATTAEMRKATENLGQHYSFRQRWNSVMQQNQNVVYFKDTHTIVVVPKMHWRKFAAYVSKNFFLGHERNIDWMNS